MNPHPYQNAYDKAISDLTEITAAFERLRERKGHLEGVVMALQPFIGEAPQVQPQHSAEIDATQPSAISAVAASDEEPPAGYSFRDVPNPLPDISETGGDPFQRRVKATFRFRGLATQRS